MLGCRHSDLRFATSRSPGAVRNPSAPAWCFQRERLAQASTSVGDLASARIGLHLPSCGMGLQWNGWQLWRCRWRSVVGTSGAWRGAERLLTGPPSSGFCDKGNSTLPAGSRKD